MSTSNTPSFINKQQYGKTKMKKPAKKSPAMPMKKPMKKGKC